MVDCCITLMLLALSIVAYHGLWKVEEDFIVSYAEQSNEVRYGLLFVVLLLVI